MSDTSPAPSAFGRLARFIGLHPPSEYIRRDLHSDSIAGLTVAIMGLPQAMAYAIVAGVPPVYGIYSAIVSCLVASLFNSSSHVISGPTNPTAIILFSVTARYIGTAGHFENVLLLTFIAGAITLLFGLLRLGGVMRYVSNSVLVGFTAGAGIVIASGQLKNLLGVEVDPKKTGTFFKLLWHLGQEVRHTNPHALFLGLLTGAIMIGSKKIHKRIPGPLVGVVVSALIVYLAGWSNANDGGPSVRILRDIEEIKGTLAIFHMPQTLRPSGFDANLVGDLFPGALALALMGLVMTSSASRTTAAQTGQKVDYSRDFLSQGMANIFGTFFMNFFGSGSLTRTALAFQAGGRTKMTGLFSALFTALILLVFGPLANYIPISSLAGMIVVIAFSMIERHRFGLAFRSGGPSRTVLFVTVASALVLPLQYTIFVGVFMSIVLLLRVTGKTNLTLLVTREDGKFEQVPIEESTPTPISLVDMEGDFYFAAVENLDDELLEVLTPKSRVVILRMKRLRAAGSTYMALLEHFWRLLKDRNVSLVICGIHKDLVKLMTQSGLRQKIGEPNIFYADNTMFQSTELALARARSIVEMEVLKESARHIPSACQPATPRPVARDLMNRRCIRFGQTHALREAAWLMSEMHRRMESADGQSLFLQDTEGRLAAELPPWEMLEKMIEGLDPADMINMSAANLGLGMTKRFDVEIRTIAKSDLARCHMDDSLEKLLDAWARSDSDLLPVIDDGDRLAGLIGPTDLLHGIGKAIQLPIEPDSGTR